MRIEKMELYQIQNNAGDKCTDQDKDVLYL